MKHFKVLPPIQLVNPLTGEDLDIEPVPMFEYLNSHPLNDKRFCHTFKNMIAGTRVLKASKDVKVGRYISLEDGDYEILIECINRPEQVSGPPLTPEKSRQLRAFQEEVLHNAIEDLPGAPPAKKPAKRAKKKPAVSKELS